MYDYNDMLLLSQTRLNPLERAISYHMIQTHHQCHYKNSQEVLSTFFTLTGLLSAPNHWILIICIHWGNYKLPSGVTSDSLTPLTASFQDMLGRVLLIVHSHGNRCPAGERTTFRSSWAWWLANHHHSRDRMFINSSQDSLFPSIIITPIPIQV